MIATKMKPSGIEWIGEIPEGWEVVRLKFLCETIKTGTTPSTSAKQYFNGTLNWFTPGDFSDKLELVNSGRKLDYSAIIDNEVPIFPAGTIMIIGIGATMGRVGFMLGEGSCNQQLTGLVVKAGIYSRELLYWLYAVFDYIRNMANFTTLPILNNQVLSNIVCIVPPIDVQQHIADYLDQKCSDIDKIILAKQRQNELLKEHRQAIIYEVVTKGLNKNVKYKDSCIEWIGEIPEDWDISKVKYFYETQLGKMLQPSQKNDNETLEKYLCSFNITWDGINQREIKEMWFNEREKKIFSIKRGDLLVSEGGDAGRACICDIDFPCYIQNAVHRVRARENAINKYLYYWLYVLKAIGYIDLLCNKATIMHFTQDKMLNIDIPIPPIDVQQHIADYLDQKCTESDRIINTNNDMIEKLKEYRQSIVYEAVIGKIDI